MKLFDDFEAVRFPEENLIFVARRKYLYYIYNPKYKSWKKYEKEGWFQITVENYPDVSKEELMASLGGVFPKKETDFLRYCQPSQLYVGNMLDLLREDYSDYMSDQVICRSVHIFLLESKIRHKSYFELRRLFNDALACYRDNEYVFMRIKELSSVIIGRDIFKEEIDIVDGHDSSSYFWIMPVRVIDYTDTNDLDNVAEMDSVEISIEEDNVYQYLTPFLYKYYDDELGANKKRVDSRWEDDDGNEHFSYVEGFEWYLTHNFYTYDSIMNMIADIKDTVEALSSERENDFTVELSEKMYRETPSELIIDFYQRFIYRIEYMIKIGEEKGYNLISFMGP